MFSVEEFLKSRKLEDYPNASATEFIKDKVNKYDIVLVSIPNNQDSSIDNIIKLAGSLFVLFSSI